MKNETFFIIENLMYETLICNVAPLDTRLLNNILFFTIVSQKPHFKHPIKKKHFAHRDVYKFNTSLHKSNRIF